MRLKNIPFEVPVRNQREFERWFDRDRAGLEKWIDAQWREYRQNPEVENRLTAQNVENYILNEAGEVTAVKWKNGTTSPCPFLPSISLGDFDGNPVAMQKPLWDLHADFDRQKAEATPGEPVQAEFESYSRFESEHETWRLETTLRKIKEEDAPPPPRQVDIPPDENRVKRIELYSRLRDWEKMEKEGLESGDHEKVDRARYHKKWVEKDIENVPESMFQTQIKGELQKDMVDTVHILFDPKINRNDPIWKTERMQHDAQLAINDFNRLGPGNTIVLPKEVSRGSRKYKPIKPGNMIRIEFDSEEKKKEFLYHVYNLGADPHDELAALGFGSVLEAKNLTTAELMESPERGSQRQFEIKMEQHKLWPAARLEALTDSEYLALREGKGWPAGKAPQEDEPVEIVGQELEAEAEQASWEDSLVPFEQSNQPNQPKGENV